MELPRPLVETWSHEPEWLADLPGLVEECAEQWGLVLEPPIESAGSLVVPAENVVLKLNAPSHVESDTEPDALELWNGTGAVLLVARDDERRALLLERCVPGTELWHADADEVQVISSLLPRLQVELRNEGPFRTLADEAERWAEEVPARYDDAGRPFERELLDAALDVYRTVDRAAMRLVNQDLHGGNILRAEREPWLVIDPKPLVGERELEATGLLRNARDVSRWLDALTDLAFDRARARGWGVAHNLAWAWDERRGWLEQHVDEARRILNAR
jgi:streptomycin 6-kinase